MAIAVYQRWPTEPAASATWPYQVLNTEGRPDIDVDQCLPPSVDRNTPFIARFLDEPMAANQIEGSEGSAARS